MFPEIFKWPLESWINRFLDWLIIGWGDDFEALSGVVLRVLVQLEGALHATPWWILIAAFGLLAWHGSQSWKLTALVCASLFLIGTLGLWDMAVQTLALIIVSVLLSILIGIPIGIVMANSDRAQAVIRPTLDGMQTMPPFVYLVPAVMLFGLGKVPAIFATVVYAAPPLIRLTNLGIRLVDREVMEASASFGTGRWGQLTKVQLPLALPSIMTGINQCTMMALGMVVIASMIGARGLGEQVLTGIQRLDVGKGFAGGLAIVALAIVIDRITQAYGQQQMKHLGQM